MDILKSSQKLSESNFIVAQISNLAKGGRPAMDNLMEYIESIDPFEAPIDALNSERADEYRSVLTERFFEKYK
jgi:hypothetical protein